MRTFVKRAGCLELNCSEEVSDSTSQNSCQDAAIGNEMRGAVAANSQIVNGHPSSAAPRGKG